jgi:phage terminase small subunit
MAADNHHGLTPKQEAFACAYVETGNASEAYRRAYQPKKMGQKAITVESTRLMQHPSIALAIEQLQAAHAERHNITVDSLTVELEKARESARSTGQISAAVSAIMGKAKLHGLIVDKQEQKRVSGDGDITGIPTDELETIVREGIARAAAAATGSRKADRVH